MGEEGDLVFTSLTRKASPVIRWNTHDVARLSSDPYGCECDRVAHPKFSRILGRSDDVLKVRGTLVFPTQIEDILSQVKGTTEGWQIVLDESREKLEKIKIEVEITQDIWGNQGEISKLETRIKEELVARFGTTGEKTLKTPNSLPRYEGKAIRVIDRSKNLGN
jgi:phenylacetate-CoA ligase